jgi:hypothetical protein
MVVTAMYVTPLPSRWHECDIGMCHKCDKLTVTSVHYKNLNTVDIHSFVYLIRINKITFYAYMGFTCIHLCHILIAKFMRLLFGSVRSMRFLYESSKGNMVFISASMSVQCVFLINLLKARFSICSIRFLYR